MSFQSLSNDRTAFVAIAPLNSHTGDSAGRGCSDCRANCGGAIEAVQQYNATGQIKFATWSDVDSTLLCLKGIGPMPEQYQRSWKMDFLAYLGDLSDPTSPGDTSWAKIGFDATKVTGVEGAPAEPLPRRYELGQNYPNPFYRSATIALRLPEATIVSLSVCNTLGERVHTEIEEEGRRSGSHAITFDASGLPNGVNRYRMMTPAFAQTRRMVLLKLDRGRLPAE